MSGLFVLPLVVMVFYIVGCLSWFECSSSWCHSYARLCAMCHGLFALLFGGSGNFNCVLSAMVCLLFLFFLMS